MRDPGSGFAWFRGARRSGRDLSHIGPALTLLLASCSSAPLPPSAAASGAPRTVVEVRRVSLSYLGPADCPGEAGFLDHVQSRATRLQLEPESVAAPLPEQVHVVLEPDPGGSGWVGELRIVGTSALTREVRGARCDDVVAALALITVLRLERSDGSLAGSASGATSAGEQTRPAEASAAGQVPARTDAEKLTPSAGAAVEDPPPEGSTPPQESTPPQVNVQEPTPTAEAAIGERTTPGAAADELARPEGEPTIAARPNDDTDETADGASSDDPATAEPLRLQASAFGHLGYSSMPSHAFKAALGAELRLGETVSSWSGSLSLALARGNDLSADGTSELTLLTAELRLCPPGGSLDAGFSLRACAQLSAGRLALSLAPNRDLATTDAIRPWLALGPSIDVGLPLSPRWTLRATSAFMFHMIRDTFESEPSPQTRVPLYRPEAISLELLLGVGYTF